jgi:hypothetical protein
MVARVSVKSLSRLLPTPAWAGEPSGDGTPASAAVPTAPMVRPRRPPVPNSM